MLVGIHQPHYLPWLRYFEKVARCDVFIVLDTVQFTKNGWQNRNKIKTAQGPAILSVPVRAKLGTRLADVRIAPGGRWRKKHWQAIRQNYAKAPFFAEHSAFLEEAYKREWERLVDLANHMLSHFAAALGIKTRIVEASSLGAPGEATERLVNLVKAVGGDAYYSGAFALQEYLDERLLREAGISLQLQKWRAPVYPQLHGEFVPDLSIVDLLMNCGPDALGIIMGEAS